MPFGLTLRVGKELDELPSRLLLLVGVLYVGNPQGAAADDRAGVVLLDLRVVPHTDFEALLLGGVHHTGQIGGGFDGDADVAGFKGVDGRGGIGTGVAGDAGVDHILPPLHERDCGVVVEAELRHAILATAVVGTAVLLATGGDLLLQVPAVDGGVEAVLCGSAILLGKLLGGGLHFIQRFRCLVRVEPGLLEQCLVVVQHRHGGVERHRIQLAVHGVVPGHVRLQIGGVVLVFIDEILHRRDGAGIHHEARTDVVDLHQRRRGLRLHGRLVFGDRFIILALVQAFDGDLALVLRVELIDHLVQHLTVRAGHGVPEVHGHGTVGLFGRRDVGVRSGIRSACRQGNHGTHRRDDGDGTGGNLVHSYSFSS